MKFKLRHYQVLATPTVPLDNFAPAVAQEVVLAPLAVVGAVDDL